MGFEDFLGVNPWTALFTLANTVTLFIVLKKNLFKPVMQMIEDRQNEIDDMYHKADDSQRRAEALQAQYEEKFAAATQEADRIVKEAVHRGHDREAEIIRIANEEASAIRELEYSSEMGLAKATYTLGAFYEFGFGTPCNREKAYALYALAEERGFCDPRNEYKLDVLKTSRKNKSNF